MNYSIAIKKISTLRKQTEIIMAKRQQGRPKRNQDGNQNLKTNEAAQAEKADTEKVPEVIKEPVEVPEAAQAEKVVEVTTPEQKTKKSRRPSEVRKKTHTVSVNGRTREITEMSYNAISRDPQIKIELPKGSALTPPSKPCKDC